MSAYSDETDTRNTGYVCSMESESETFMDEEQVKLSFGVEAQPAVPPPYRERRTLKISNTTFRRYDIDCVETPKMDRFEKIDDLTLPKHNRRCRRWIILSIAIVLIIAVGLTLGAVMASGGDDKASAIDIHNDINIGSSKEPAETPAPVTQTPAPSTLAPTTREPSILPTQAPLETPAPTTEAFYFIKSNLAGGGKGLAYSDSYQSKALKFVEESYIAGTHDQNRILQRLALACIYYATYKVDSPFTNIEFQGSAVFFGWQSDDGWLKDADECSWYGITCNEQGFVEGIDLSGNLLTGSFPPETALLKESLVRLNLKKNMMYNFADAGTRWLGQLTQLKELDLSETPFHYKGIPSAIGKLVDLEILDISYSLFFGELRDRTFSKLKNLQFLDIGGNSYNSSLPLSIGNLTKLQYFYASDCDLEGDLSVWTQPAQTPGLYELWIDQNPKVVGPIPPEIGQYSNLASLSLTGLGISGPIPKQLGDLSEMKQLWLYGNKLNGEIPPQLGNLTKLSRLELEANDLIGSMPNQICQNVLLDMIEVLEADCAQSNPEVSCDYPNCCTCCGHHCMDSAPRLHIQTQGGSRRMLSHNHIFRKNTKNSRLLDRQQQRRDRAEQLKDPDHAKDAAANRRKRLAFHAKRMEILSSKKSH